MKCGEGELRARLKSHHELWNILYYFMQQLASKEQLYIIVDCWRTTNVCFSSLLRQMGRSVVFYGQQALWAWWWADSHHFTAHYTSSYEWVPRSSPGSIQNDQVRKSFGLCGNFSKLFWDEFHKLEPKSVILLTYFMSYAWKKDS